MAAMSAAVLGPVIENGLTARFRAAFSSGLLMLP